ncbi:tRNA (adenosine(37)-N6)-threonylcarbamoyltransferase complex ATPase subunit type 1 TsaE [Serpentinicella alkaliphila]|uniref:tRNA threonylcarbamoyladenosine biosynthesis protein TsaE n=1 Tax=Serpentinicella alkaliphila TaxID=1734049 RepID=A0A4R2THT8_9FIRM|nr:tRNA (adenosine(37)-N6)-threonylcarbamoyltransferase complex ATPase subunit type 1 TsaE [Serpentinicella alkaliphila]QUH24889.1 tRNA (adenosine(37)-N6)-threonylcarbamoyltransferase complex ATPase subunit type 1 TsaE [Serpentinicella alkaliphila]TCQ01837.1 tRNA threonylcarbamoyladenosine biosynthesis protein TsaE [Serpentinicella alkaliphila]
MLSKNINNLEETQKLAYKLGKLVKSGDVICLIGDLGAGKTTFTQSLAKGMEVNDYVTSPTFTIVQEYEGRLPLYHFDVYRISDASEMYDIGFDEYVYGQGVCVIEWAHLIKNVLPKNYLWIELTHVEEDKRKIHLEYTNDYYKNLAEEMLAE